MKHVFTSIMLISIMILMASCENAENKNTMDNKTKAETNTTTETSEVVMQYGMFVGSKKLPFDNGMATQQCLMVRASWETVWTPLFTEIEGFDYEPGYEYHLEVKRTPIKNPAADASAYRYELVRVLNKVKKESDLRLEHEKPTFESTWNLIRLNGKDVSSYKAFAVFDKNSMSANSGCNTMTGISFSANNKNGLSVKTEPEPITTLMACPNDHIESEYFKTLFTAKTYKASSRELKIYNKEGKEILVFTR